MPRHRAKIFQFNCKTPGLRLDFDKPTSYKNNDWLLVEGELVSEYYAPFKRELPVVKVSQVKQIQAPKNEYVYRTF
ncbi:hypothetical protein V4S28_08835 [Enterococcus cecorum]